jgi:hypothetical protein
MRDQTASLLIGTLADQVLGDLEHDTVSGRGRAAAERLEHLISLVVAFRTGELSEVNRDPDLSATAAHSLIATAALRLGKLRDGVGGLDAYRLLLEAFRQGALDPPGRAVLAPFLETLAMWSAEAAQTEVPAFYPEENDRRRYLWTRR